MLINVMLSGILISSLAVPVGVSQTDVLSNEMKISGAAELMVNRECNYWLKLLGLCKV